MNERRGQQEMLLRTPWCMGIHNLANLLARQIHFSWWWDGCVPRLNKTHNILTHSRSGQRNDGKQRQVTQSRPQTYTHIKKNYIENKNNRAII